MNEQLPENLGAHKQTLIIQMEVNTEIHSKIISEGETFLVHYMGQPMYCTICKMKGHRAARFPEKIKITVNYQKKLSNNTKQKHRLEKTKTRSKESRLTAACK